MAIERHFCTYFDINYLSRGLALYQSLLSNCHNFKLLILCMDEEVFHILSCLNYKEITLIRINELEAYETKLMEAKSNRSRIEYYFTCTSVLPLFIFESKCKGLDQITYIDADLFFYSDPEVIFDEIGENSIAIIEHHFPERFRSHEKYGKFNVGILSFRSTDEGLSCLKDWSSLCLDWCYDRLEGEKYADQKYLDVWPSRYKSLIVLKNRGVNVAPWNIPGSTIQRIQNEVYINNVRLVVYHFHGLKFINRFLINTGLGYYLQYNSKLIRIGIYRPYINSLLTVEDVLLKPYRKLLDKKLIRKNNKQGFFQGIKNYISLIHMVLLRNYMLVLKKNKITCRDELSEG